MFRKGAAAPSGPAGGGYPGQPSPTASLNQDWATREFTQQVQSGVAQLISFLDRFGTRALRAHTQPK